MFGYRYLVLLMNHTVGARSKSRQKKEAPRNETASGSVALLAPKDDTGTYRLSSHRESSMVTQERENPMPYRMERTNDDFMPPF